MCKIDWKALEENPCQMNELFVPCGEHNGVASLCVIHHTIFEIWIASGGHTVYDNSSLTIEDMRERFKRDIESLELDFHKEFDDEFSYKLEAAFSKLFEK